MKEDTYLVWKKTGVLSSKLAYIRAASASFYTQKEMCIDLQISEKTFIALKNKHPEIAKAIEEGEAQLLKDMFSTLKMKAVGHKEKVTTKSMEKNQLVELKQKLMRRRNITLLTLKLLKEGRLDNATDYLMIPQYFTYKLTGKKVHEYTSESTTGLINAVSKEYDFDIIDKLSLPHKLFSKIVPSGTYVGRLLPEVEKEVGGNLNVIVCASHDTGSAFEAVDCDSDSIIISSGTWSILGVKSKTPVTSKTALETNFTNEGGVNYIRLCKNIMGMWIVNEISRRKSINLVEICQKLDNVQYKEIFNVNDNSLFSTSNMERTIRNLLKGREPQNDEELFSSAFHSLAYCYNEEVKNLESITGKQYKNIYIVGGGAKNKYLNKLVELYTGKKVIPLPIEATSIGNLKVQMKK